MGGRNNRRPILGTQSIREGCEHAAAAAEISTVKPHFPVPKELNIDPPYDQQRNDNPQHSPRPVAAWLFAAADLLGARPIHNLILHHRRRGAAHSTTPCPALHDAGPNQPGTSRCGPFLLLAGVRDGPYTDAHLPIGFARVEYQITPVRQRKGGQPIQGPSLRVQYTPGTVANSTAITPATVSRPSSHPLAA